MNSRLLNIPAILIAVVTVSIGSFIYNSSKSTISDAMESISTQDAESFNSLFLMYEGEQSGSNVKLLIGKLISNANMYENDSTQVPYLYIDQLNETTSAKTELVFRKSNEGDATEYINELNEIKKKIDSVHTYYVEMTYQENGYIDYINISFDPDNRISELQYRTGNSLFDTFNEFDNQNSEYST